MIDIAFIWHMHQPCYKDGLKGHYLLPWVRLHGIKDYYPMAALLEPFDHVKATFNMVPSLVEQIDDYVKNNASDTFLDLTLKRPGDMTLGEKAQALDCFFKVNFRRFVEPHPRYKALLAKRGTNAVSSRELKKAACAFQDNDLLDLQVLFNLSWFHSLTVDADPNLKEIIEKGEGYSEEDKRYVVKKQNEVLARIIPLYKRLQDDGRIEITTTPYYHPILPLLCNTDIAKVSAPDAVLPKPRFSHSEDARWHIERAVLFHEKVFGRRPRGMWPSEGSVSEEALDLLINAGFDWVATDEDILFYTLGTYEKAYKARPIDRRLVYQPYRFQRDGRYIDVIFRDKNLSNLISFTYADWDPQLAALDLLGHFQRISENMRRETDRGLVAIVMDGENAWEHFEDNGRRFFELLYSRLDEGESVRSSTVTGHLRAFSARRALKNIFPGSWIEHNFKIWIGAPQDNLSWQYLLKARRDLRQFTREADMKDPGVVSRIEQAWKEIYISEGSDWNWWYGPENKPGPTNPFDTLYRMHLRNVYKLARKPVPDYLKKQIV